MSAKTVVLSAGAIGTPSLLQRSSLGVNVGRRLQLHPTIKVVAMFDEEVNSADMGVPVHQVKEFAPRFSFGCSISSKPYLGLAMLDHPDHAHLVETDWKRMAIYYAMIVPQGHGRVRAIPGFGDPLVTYSLSPDDLRALSEALRKLCELLFAAGARSLFPSISGQPHLRQREDLAMLPAAIPRDRTNLMSIHLFSSCPMGEDPTLCVADSFGRVHGHDRLLISDASLLPTAPGVNPQGSVMAFARRNARALSGVSPAVTRVH
jgi:choline dehydrogenase-like flavoprotein